MRPLLLMDVDGPLNPFEAPWFLGHEAHGGFRFHELTPTGGHTYRVALDPRHGQELLGLAEHYDLAWATTWLDDANRLIAPILGLPDDLPVVPLRRDAVLPSARCWKAEQIAQWVGARPFAWFDDEINPATRSWLDGQGRLGPHLAHRVEPRVGLTSADFDALTTFAEELSTS